MRRVVLVCVMLALASLACLSSTEPTNEPVRQNIATVTRPPTFIPTTTSGASVTFSTATPATSGGAVGPALPPSNCPIPANWRAYTVRAGDTLAVLASAVGTTTQTLQTGNCITNPDAIFVGNTIYLPNLPAIVPTAVATQAGSQCPVPGGWQPYTIRSGDTLSLIALSIGTTTQTLQNGNCITNPDAIFVGQTLYLPSLPPFAPTAAATLTPAQTAAPITNTPSSNAPPTLNQLLRISPTQVRSDGALVTTQRTISLDVGAVSNANNVRYFAGTSATDQNPVLVGIDQNPADGTRIDYTLNQFDDELFFIAVAENQAGFTSSNIVRVVYDPNFNQAAGAPFIQPFEDFSNETYTLQPGSSVTIAWPNAPQDANRIEFYYLPAGSAAPQVVGTDSTPSNGALISWLVPQSASGQVFARAVFDGRLQDSERVAVRTP